HVRGRGQLEGRYGDLICTEKEQGAKGRSAAGGDLRSKLCCYTVYRSHQRAKGVVHRLSRMSLLIVRKLGSYGLRDMAGYFFRGVFLMLFPLFLRYPFM